MIDHPLTLTAVIAAATLTAFLLDYKVPALGKVGASLLALILGALLSNFGVVPAASPVYDQIAGPVTLLAIAWLLLAVNVSDLKVAGPRMVGAFALAAVGTATGAFVGALVFAGFLGEDTWRLAGTLTGTYTGGSLNFVAVGTGLGLPAQLFAGATAADALTTGLWLGATLLLPLWIGRFYPPVPEAALRVPGAREDGAEGAGPTASGEPVPGTTTGPEGDHAHHPFFLRQPVSTLDLAVLLAAGFFLLAASGAMATWLGGLAEAGVVPGWIGGIPSVLWLTTFALVLGHTRFFREPSGALQLGTLALHFFFVVIGIWSRVSEILAVGVEVFFYTLVVVGVHGLVVFGGGKLARIDVGSLAVASQAAVGGPSSALAVAVSRKWPGFILPGIIVGLFGYAVGNYLGFGVAYLVRGLGIGL
ncbi:MAG: DUF819 family protein [Longimicrobiales bacterium]